MPVLKEEVYEIDVRPQFSAPLSQSLPELSTTNRGRSHKTKQNHKRLLQKSKKQKIRARNWRSNLALQNIVSFDDIASEETVARRDAVQDAADRKTEHTRSKLSIQGEAVMRRFPKFVLRKDFAKALIVLEEARNIFAKASSEKRLSEVAALIERCQGDHFAVTLSGAALANRDYDQHIKLLRKARDHYRIYSESRYRHELKFFDSPSTEMERADDSHRFEVVSNIKDKTRLRAIDDGQRAVDQACKSLKANGHASARQFYLGAKKSFEWVDFDAGKVLVDLHTQITIAEDRAIKITKLQSLIRGNYGRHHFDLCNLKVLMQKPAQHGIRSLISCLAIEKITRVILSSNRWHSKEPVREVLTVLQQEDAALKLASLLYQQFQSPRGQTNRSTIDAMECRFAAAVLSYMCAIVSISPKRIPDNPQRKCMALDFERIIRVVIAAMLEMSLCTPEIDSHIEKYGRVIMHTGIRLLVFFVTDQGAISLLSKPSSNSSANINDASGTSTDVPEVHTKPPVVGWQACAACVLAEDGLTAVMSAYAAALTWPYTGYALAEAAEEYSRPKAITISTAATLAGSVYCMMRVATDKDTMLLLHESQGLMRVLDTMCRFPKFCKHAESALKLLNQVAEIMEYDIHTLVPIANVASAVVAVTMEPSNMNIAIHFNASQLISLLVKTQSRAREIIEAGGVAALLRMHANAQGNLDVLVQTTDALNCVLSSPGGISAIQQCNFHGGVAKALHGSVLQYSNEVRYAVSALAFVEQWSTFRHSSRELSVSTVFVMEKHMNSMEMTATASRAMDSLLRSPRNAAFVIEKAGLHVLTTALRTYDGRKTVLEPAAAALAKLVSHSDVCPTMEQHIEETGATNLMLSLLEKHYMFPSFTQQCIAYLVNIKQLSLQAIPLVIIAMKKHAKKPQIQQEGSLVLSNIVSNKDNVVELISRCGVSALLVADEVAKNYLATQTTVMGGGKTKQEVVEDQGQAAQTIQAAFRKKVCHKELKKQSARKIEQEDENLNPAKPFGHVGKSTVAANAMAKLLCQPTALANIQQHEPAADVVARYVRTVLACQEDHSTELITQGAVDYTISCMIDHLKDMKIQLVSCQSLFGFANVPKFAALIVDKGGIKPLVDAHRYYSKLFDEREGHASKQIMIAAMAALKQLASTPDAVLCLEQAAGFESVLNSLSKHPQMTQHTENALGFLSRVTGKDTGVVVKQVVNGATMSAVIHAIAQSPQHYEIQRTGEVIIKGYTTTAAMIERIFDTNGIAVLTAAQTEYASNAPVMTLIVELYTELCTDSVHAESVDYGGGISITMRNVREYPMFTQHTMAALQLVLQILFLKHFSYTLAVVGVPAILQSMAHEENVQNSKLQLLGCKALTQLVDGEQDCVAWLRSGGVEVMLGIFGEHSKNSRVTAHAILMLARVGSFKIGGRAIMCGTRERPSDDAGTEDVPVNDDERSEKLSREGQGKIEFEKGAALLAPITALDIHCSNQTYTCALLQFIYTLLVNESAQFEAAGSQIEDSTVRAICRCMEEHMQHTEADKQIQMLAASAMQLLASTTSACNNLLRHGAAECLLGMHQNATSEEVVVEAVTTLRALVANHDSIELLEEANVIGNLGELFKQQLDSANISESVLVFWVRCWTVMETHPTVVKTEICVLMEATVSAMLHHSSVEAVQSNSCKLFGLLCTSEAALSDLRRSGVLTAVSISTTDHRHHEKVLIEVLDFCMRLCKFPISDHLLRQSRILKVAIICYSYLLNINLCNLWQIIMQSLSVAYKNEDGAFTLLTRSLLCSVSAAEELGSRFIQLFVESGVIRVVIAAMRSHKTNLSVLQDGIGALRCLSDTPQHALMIVESGGLVVISCAHLLAGCSDQLQIEITRTITTTLVRSNESGQLLAQKNGNGLLVDLLAWLGPILQFVINHTSLLPHTDAAVVLFREFIDLAAGSGDSAGNQAHDTNLISDVSDAGMGGIALCAMIAVILCQSTSYNTVLQATRCLYHMVKIQPRSGREGEVALRFIALNGAQGLVAIHKNFNQRAAEELLTLSAKMLAELAKDNKALTKQFTRPSGRGAGEEVQELGDSVEDPSTAGLVAPPGTQSGESLLSEETALSLKPFFESCQSHASDLPLSRHLLDFIVSCAYHEHDADPGCPSSGIIRSLIEEGAVEAVEAVMAAHVSDFEIQKRSWQGLLDLTTRKEHVGVILRVTRAGQENESLRYVGTALQSQQKHKILSDSDALQFVSAAVAFPSTHSVLVAHGAIKMLVGGMHRNQQDSRLLVRSAEVLEELALEEGNVPMLMASDLVPELVAMHKYHNNDETVLCHATSLLLRLLAFSRKPLQQIIQQGGLGAVMATLRDHSDFIQHSEDALGMLLLAARFRCEMKDFMEADVVSAIISAFGVETSLDVRTRAVKSVSALANLKENTSLISTRMVQSGVVGKLQSPYHHGDEDSNHLQSQVISSLIALIRSFAGQESTDSIVSISELEHVLPTPITVLTKIIASTTETTQKQVIDRMLNEDGVGAVAAVMKTYPRLAIVVINSFTFVMTVIAKSAKLAERVASGPFVPATVASMELNLENTAVQTRGAEVLSCLATTDRTARLFIDAGALDILTCCHSAHRNVESVVFACTSTLAQILSQDIDLGCRLIKAGCVQAACDTLQAKPTFKQHNNTTIQLLQTLVEGEGIIEPLSAKQKAGVSVLLKQARAAVEAPPAET